MTDFDIDPERINVFHIGDEYLFSHYFDRKDLFEQLQEYYIEESYRFEVPADAFDEIRELLETNYFEVTVIDDPEPYCVVKDKYTEHAEILRESVVSWERRGQLFFVMSDELAVKEALEQGATRLDETDYVLGL